MPKEVVQAATRDSLVDAVVSWDKDRSPYRNSGGELAPQVHLMFSADRPGLHKGQVRFHYENPEAVGLNPGDAVSPVSVGLDREQINRLIRVLRHARDQAYGKDA